ncbi:glycoside hydrolase family 3 C-terminal domain-containing protein [Granulicella arctica]|uniref:glycoside hydrolase family 3 C-terminal domain-containing protein n=1 Tax=Granulicella arctica TaxID=940613 RepID=UPI0021E02A74|nr:glycoside hydrolase family 3 C-terminal domain-containing protein [Granulicella arctica]
MVCLRIIRTAARASIVALSLSPAVLCAQTSQLYLDPSQPIDKRVDDLVSRMTLDEKITQTINTSPAIPRLGIPAYDWWNEGLHGVARSGYATMFPQAIGMAATWDTALFGQIGDTISTEARAKYNEAVRHDIHAIYYGLTFWSPNINIFRDPRWGRGQETYGEDPFLTSRLGVSFVRGLQGTNPDYFKVIATPKHFAVHSGPESDRHRFNVEPTPHDLWDTYLPAFRATIVEGRADSIMCAYNRIDGSPACADHELLGQILRQDWGFKGYVTSDCGAIDDFYQPTAHRTSPDKETAAAEGIKAGTDTSCGDTYLALGDSIKRGLVTEAQIDVSLKRLFKARFQLGIFDPPSKVPYNDIAFSEVGSPAHRALALEVARKSMVLLKNDENFLPLKGVHTIAVIGPNATSLAAIEGNYNAVPLHPVLPLDGIAAEFPQAKVLYAQGSPYAETAPTTIPRTQFRAAVGSAIEGLKAEYFNNDALSGQPVITRIDKQLEFDWNVTSPDPVKLDAKAFSARWSGTLQAPAPGDYEISGIVAHCYRCAQPEQYTIRLDGKELIPESADKAQHGAALKAVKVHFDDTRPHPFEVTYLHHAMLEGTGFSLQWVAPVEPMRAQAMEAVRKADVVIAFVGLSPNLEGEEMPIHISGFAGGDRTDITLPAAQQQLLEAAKATGKPLVVVLMNGSALAVDWAQQNANAILEAWYPGEAGGQAIAETLSGKNNPAGRLPITFYESIDQLPPFSDYAMANRTYRYFKGKPLYGFGYGLSYTSFLYGHLKLSTNHLHAGGTLIVDADIKNIGARDGDEVAELYLTPPHTDVSPQYALDGFTRVHIGVGQTQHVHFELDSRTLSQVDVKGTRAVSPGSYKITVGGGQPMESKGESVDFTIEGTRELPH